MNRFRKFMYLLIVSVLFIYIGANYNKFSLALNLIKNYVKNSNSITISDPSAITEDKLSNPLDGVLSSINSDNIAIDLVKNSESEDIDPNHEEPLNKAKTQKTSKEKSASHSISKEIPQLVEEPRSYITIISEYNNLLLDMKSSFEAELNALIQEGIEEYTNSKSSKAKLADKYLSLGSRLEKDSDAKFKELLNNMKKELQENNYSTSIIKDTEAYYISFKETKKTEVINRGMKYLR